MSSESHPGKDLVANRRLRPQYQIIPPAYNDQNGQLVMGNPQGLGGASMRLVPQVPILVSAGNQQGPSIHPQYNGVQAPMCIDPASLNQQCQQTPQGHMRGSGSGRLTPSQQSNSGSPIQQQLPAQVLDQECSQTQPAGVAVIQHFTSPSIHPQYNGVQAPWGINPASLTQQGQQTPQGHMIGSGSGRLTFSQQSDSGSWIQQQLPAQGPSIHPQYNGVQAPWGINPASLTQQGQQTPQGHMIGSGSGRLTLSQQSDSGSWIQQQLPTQGPSMHPQYNGVQAPWGINPASLTQQGQQTPQGHMIGSGSGRLTLSQQSDSGSWIQQQLPAQGPSIHPQYNGVQASWGINPASLTQQGQQTPQGHMIGSGSGRLTLSQQSDSGNWIQQQLPAQGPSIHPQYNGVQAPWGINPASLTQQGQQTPQGHMIGSGSGRLTLSQQSDSGSWIQQQLPTQGPSMHPQYNGVQASWGINPASLTQQGQQTPQGHMIGSGSGRLTLSQQSDSGSWIQQQLPAQGPSMHPQYNGVQASWGINPASLTQQGQQTPQGHMIGSGSGRLTLSQQSDSGSWIQQQLPAQGPSIHPQYNGVQASWGINPASLTQQGQQTPQGHMIGSGSGRLTLSQQSDSGNWIQQQLPAQGPSMHPQYNGVQAPWGINPASLTQQGQQTPQGHMIGSGSGRLTLSQQSDSGNWIQQQLPAQGPSIHSQYNGVQAPWGINPASLTQQGQQTPQGHMIGSGSGRRTLSQQSDSGSWIQQQLPAQGPSMHPQYNGVQAPWGINPASLTQQGQQTPQGHMIGSGSGRLTLSQQSDSGSWIQQQLPAQGPSMHPQYNGVQAPWGINPASLTQQGQQTLQGHMIGSGSGRLTLSQQSDSGSWIQQQLPAQGPSIHPQYNGVQAPLGINPASLTQQGQQTPQGHMRGSGSGRLTPSQQSNSGSPIQQQLPTQGPVIHPKYYGVQVPMCIDPASLIQQCQQTPQGHMRGSGSGRLTPSQQSDSGSPIQQQLPTQGDLQEDHNSSKGTGATGGSASSEMSEDHKMGLPCPDPYISDNLKQLKKPADTEEKEKRPFGITAPQNQSNSPETTTYVAQPVGTTQFQDKHVGIEESPEEYYQALREKAFKMVQEVYQARQERASKMAQKSNQAQREKAFEMFESKLKEKNKKDENREQLTVIPPNDAARLIEVDKSLNFKFKKSDTSKRIMLKETEQHLNKYYAEDLKYFTDASKSHKSVYFAMVIPEKNDIITVRLDNTVSVYEAEFTAINYAIEYGINYALSTQTNKPLKIAIITDALWVLQAIESGKSKTSLLKNLLYLQEQCRGKNIKFNLVWVPAHVGLPGNEMANTAANGARQSLQVK